MRRPLAPTHPLAIDGAVELAVLERGGLIESRHLGAAVVVGPDGSVLRELGDGSAAVFGRSSLKLFQAVAVMRSGVELHGELAAVAAASHAGTPEHLRVVRELLDRAGVTERDLRCPRAWPLDREAMLEAHAHGHGMRRITMNCSGKHAAFLAACSRNRWPLNGYLELTHPLQESVRETIEAFTGAPVGPLGIDGCGAPVFATSLRGLATGVGRITGALRGQHRDQHAHSLAAGILENPWAIDGPGRPNTVVAERLGLVAKGGAEGVLVIGAPDGTALALKILDGSSRATTLVGLELLVSVGALTRDAADPVIASTTERVLGGETTAGALRVSELLR